MILWSSRADNNPLSYSVMQLYYGLASLFALPSITIQSCWSRQSLFTTFVFSIYKLTCINLTMLGLVELNPN